jgi:site-specific DNA-methyltransferase (adenine-specific)
MKAPKNKTIDLDLEEGRAYLDRCLRLDTPAALGDVLDRTICGDSFAVLPLLPRGFADLLIVDPPYNLSKDFHGLRFARMDDAAYEAYTGQWLDAALPCLKPNGSVYVCCDWRSSAVIGRVLESRLHVRNRITWQREKGRGAKKNWKNSMEDIWFATVSEDYSFDADAVRQRRRVLAPYRDKGQPKDWQETKDGRFRDTAPSNFWDDISIPYWSMPENTAHPTQKPEKLMAKLVLASCPKGGTVLDPFLGSGSSAVTAKKLGRHFVGIEQNPRYCVWCEKRLELAERNPGIQGYADGVFWERNTFALQKRAESE